jgi:hypothetical protein
MRGLDTRTNYALAKIARLAGRPDAAARMEDAVESAINDGFADYRNGVHTIPPLLSDVPMLNAAWDYGHDEARFFSGPDGFD